MVLQAKALLAGLGLAATAAIALGSKEAKASETGAPKPSTGGKKATKSSKGKPTPSGVDPGHLADKTTEAMIRQDIAALRDLVGQWKAAGDEFTSAALSEDLETSVQGANLEQWEGDGQAGSPLLRAFGERVLLVEGRPEKLLLWSDAWRATLPILAAALKTKADAIDVAPEKGSTDDPVVPPEILEQIIAAETKGDPTALRVLADKVEAAGFSEAAADLRALADLIESRAVKPPNPAKPAPAPVPLPHEPQPDPSEKQPPKPPAPAPTPSLPAGGAGRIVIVKKGEGPFQVTQRLLGKDQGGRFHELVNENVPPKKKAKDGGFTSLNAGEKLKVPASWPASKDAILDTSPAAQTAVTLPATTSTGDRFVIVKKGEGPWAITERVLGAGQGNAHWKELVAANVPPKKKDSKSGNFTTLAIGERLKVPSTWPASSEIVFGADDGGVYAPPMSSRQSEAGKIAMCATLGKLDRETLADWQRREKIPATGDYDTTSAYVLCFRFGIVPPVPKKFAGPQARKKFAAQMMAAARKDPQRGDEYASRAKAALIGKVA